MLQSNRTAGAPPNYLAWREQRKLLLWVLLIGVPIIGGLRAWELWQTAGARRPVDDVHIDPRLPESGHSLPSLDTFTAEAAVEDGQDEEAKKNRHDTEKYFPGVMPNYLESVRDDTPSRPGDQDACFNLLQTLNRAEAKELKAASLGPVTYVQLFRQPEAYRGRLVDLRGTVRRTELVKLPENHTGLTQYYRLWLRPDDSTNPIIIYAIELPEGFPIDQKVREPVEITGFFFKRVAYAAQSGGITAPMLLAKSVEWKAPSPLAREAAAERSQGRLQWLMGIVVIGSVILIGVMWQLNRAARRPFVKRAEASADSMNALKEADVATVEDELGRLSHE
jgi:hypothetical protein